MANRPIDMNKIRQILLLHRQSKSKSFIAAYAGVSRITIRKYLDAFDASGLSLAELENLSDAELDERFSRPETPSVSKRMTDLRAVFPEVEKNLKKTGATREAEWRKYRAKHPDGIGLSQFKLYFRRWVHETNPSMHIEHRAGDKLFVDFAGDKLALVNPDTGEIRPVEVFIAVLGASQLMYVEATESQQTHDFVGACSRALHYYGGVPAAIVPDNLKPAVTTPCRYEPRLNENFAEFTRYYGFCSLPARVRKPQDKAHVERAVRIVYSKIHAVLDGKPFASLQELNKVIAELLEDINNARFSKRPYSRRQLFEEIEYDELKPLPLLPYEYRKYNYATVAKTCHACLSADKHYYSVPYQYVGKKVKISYSSTEVEIHYKHNCIARHKRNIKEYRYTTVREHMASHHQFVHDWSVDYFLTLADAVHDDVTAYFRKIFERCQHPEQGYKSCQGILRLAHKNGKDRVAAACRRAAEFGLISYGTIKKILEKGLDDNSADTGSQFGSVPEHDNIRGSHNYH